MKDELATLLDRFEVAVARKRAPGVLNRGGEPDLLDLGDYTRLEVRPDPGQPQFIGSPLESLFHHRTNILGQPK